MLKRVLSTFEVIYSISIKSFLATPSILLVFFTTPPPFVYGLTASLTLQYYSLLLPWPIKHPFKHPPHSSIARTFMWAHGAGLIVLRDGESTRSAAATACQPAAMVRVVSGPTVCVSAEPIRPSKREIPWLRQSIRPYNQKRHYVTSCYQNLMSYFSITIWRTIPSLTTWNLRQRKQRGYLG